MSERLVTFEDVWKEYPRWESAPTLRTLLVGRRPTATAGRRWALEGLTFDLGPGDFVGLVGPTGAGKSTVLRLASGVSTASRGRIRTPPDTASVLSLGYSFDGTLSGAENAYTSALLAGLSPRQARAALPSIVEFAELPDYAEAPLRTYSDGMKLRLAFGVLAHLHPRALLLDEVLAVGDAHFQQKCLARIDELRDAGTAVLFASHDLEQVKRHCNAAVWLQQGRLRAFGEAKEVVGQYESASHAETLSRTPVAAASEEDAGPLRVGENRLGSQEVTIEDVVLTGDPECAPGSIRSGGRLEIAFRLRAHHGPVIEPILGVTLWDDIDGVAVWDINTQVEGVVVGTIRDVADVRLVFDSVPLAPGPYIMDVGVYEPDWQFAYDFHGNAYRLVVTGGPPSKGLIRPLHAWTVSRRTLP
jgi:lipopolysaccharide transport system ATP-binding protein